MDWIGIGFNGGSARRPQMAAEAAGHGGTRRVYLSESLLDAITHSLDVAARGYLCAPLVDCDPATDPECSEAGKKLQFVPADKNWPSNQALGRQGEPSAGHTDRAMAKPAF